MGTEARALAETTRLDWDRLEFTELLALNRYWTEPVSFESLESGAKDYLRPNRHGRTMADQVKELLRQIEAEKFGSTKSEGDLSLDG